MDLLMGVHGVSILIVGNIRV